MDYNIFRMRLFVLLFAVLDYASSVSRVQIWSRNSGRFLLWSFLSFYVISEKGAVTCMQNEGEFLNSQNSFRPDIKQLAIPMKTKTHENCHVLRYCHIETVVFDSMTGFIIKFYWLKCQRELLQLNKDIR